MHLLHALLATRVKFVITRAVSPRDLHTVSTRSASSPRTVSTDSNIACQKETLHRPGIDSPG